MDHVDTYCYPETLPGYSPTVRTYTPVELALEKSWKMDGKGWFHGFRCFQSCVASVPRMFLPMSGCQLHQVFALAKQGDTKGAAECLRPLREVKIIKVDLVSSTLRQSLESSDLSHDPLGVGACKITNKLSISGAGSRIRKVCRWSQFNLSPWWRGVGCLWTFWTTSQKCQHLNFATFPKATIT